MNECPNCGSDFLVGHHQEPRPDGGILKEKECVDCESKIIITLKVADVNVKEGYFKD